MEFSFSSLLETGLGSFLLLFLFTMLWGHLRIVGLLGFKKGSSRSTNVGKCTKERRGYLAS